jgi:hypothetical protein
LILLRKSLVEALHRGIFKIELLVGQNDGHLAALPRAAIISSAERGALR